MTLRVVPLTETEAGSTSEERGLGALQTERGNLPLESIEAAVAITGLVGRIQLTQGFQNPHDVPLEATYVFPLPDRAAVTAMKMTADGRTVTAELREREQARAQYDQAIAEGRRAAIAEEDRPDVFTMRVGNILPGERVSVALTLVGPLSYEDGEATFRLPLVVAPRYIPGTPVGSTVGDGYSPDTDAVPDASRITPPVLLPGFPNPVRLAIDVDIDPAGLPLGDVRSSLHAVVGEGRHLSIQPGERANRDFIMRLSYGEAETSATSLSLTPDEPGEGTFRLTVLPPTSAAPARPRDVVLVLDRSGSMMGWKMVAARRAAARIVDTLTATDRFAVLAFDDRFEYPSQLGTGLHAATDRNRFRAVEFLATVDSRGGTELLAPLTEALKLLSDKERDRVVVLVTDGQVGNEDQILAKSAPALHGVRVHTVGIDQAVNAGFLGRLAAVGGGRCELVESEDRLDAAMDHIHRRIGAPVVSGLSLAIDGVELIDDTVSPARLPDLFPGAPLVVTGRYRAEASSEASARVDGRTRAGEAWSVSVPAATVADSAVTSVWARAHLRDLEDRYVSAAYGGDQALERRIVEVSLRYGVLCRFTAWVVVDERVVVENGEIHRVMQPVEPPAGWDMLARPAPMMTLAGYAAAPAPMMMAPPTGAPRMRASTASVRGMFKRPAPVEGARGGADFELMTEHAPPEVSDWARTLAGQEAERLRAGSDAPEYERRELLTDLGTRLDALVRELIGTREGATVAELVPLLAEEHVAGLTTADLTALWDRTLAVLDALATGSAGSADSGTRGKPFWKR